MRSASPGTLALGALLLAGPAWAQGKPLAPPVEMTVTLEDGKPVRAPAELRLPAGTDVSLRIVSSADAPVTITAPGQFEKGLVLHGDGDLTHVASERGYTVKRMGRGTLRLRTMKAGQETYARTSTWIADAPFKGKLVLTQPAG